LLQLLLLWLSAGFAALFQSLLLQLAACTTGTSLGAKKLNWSHPARNAFA